MMNKKIASILIIGLLISSCSQKEAEDARDGGQATDDAALAASDAVSAARNAALAASDECRGFVDGSSRPWTLAGIGLADDISRVRQQLRCGDLVFSIEEKRESDYIFVINGVSGNDRISVDFAGVNGEGQVTRVSRSADYSNGGAVTVKDLTDNIRAKFPEVTILYGREGTSSSSNRGLGFGESPSGERFDNMSQIAACSFSAYKMRTPDTRCGRNIYVYLGSHGVLERGVLKAWQATLSNSAATYPAVKAARESARIERSRSGA